jgi:uncharacterized membrane protein
MRRRHVPWSNPPRTIPKHPIRDAALLYGVLAVALVLIAWASGTSVSRAIVLAVGVFVVALGWSVLSWRRQMREVRREEFDA